MEIHKLISPKNICVYGVSMDPKKLGSVVYQNIVMNGFTGKVFPINPKYTEIFNTTCYPDASSIVEEIDLAVVVTPSQFVNSIMEDVGKKGIPSAIVISAGFSEIGKEGKVLEDELKNICTKYNISLLGPNCLGLINTNSKLNASFAEYYPSNGNIAFLSQSGAFGSALLDFSAKKHLGIGQFVSVGNKAGVDEVDFVSEWLLDPSIKVIALYIEEFSRGLDLVECIRKSEVRKPIILLNPGSSESAKGAISSHTGSMAGESKLIQVAFKKLGVIQVDSIEDMFNYLMMFSWNDTNNVSDDKSVTILTNAGGPGIMLTDLIENKGLPLTVLSDKTKEELSKVLPSSASNHNPIDMVGDATAKRYIDVLNVLKDSSEVNNILAILTPQAVTEVEESAKTIIDFSKSTKKNIFPLFIGGEFIESAIAKFKEAKLPFFKYDEDCVDSIYAFLKYDHKGTDGKDKSLDILELVKEKSNNIKVKLSLSDKEVALSEEQVISLSSDFNIPLCTLGIFNDVNELLKKLTFKEDGTLEKKLVLKATTEDIAHKTDFKAVYLNISNKNELLKAFKELQTNIISFKKINFTPKVLVQEMLNYPLELLIGVKRDGNSKVYENHKGFGHFLVFGMGGIYTEVLSDISIASLPLTRDEVIKLISETKVSQIIDGARGKEKLNKESLIDVILKLQDLVLTYPEISSIDINPILISESDVKVVDFKIFVKE